MEGEARVEAASPSEDMRSPSRPNKAWMADWLDALCPYYMSLGLSCEQFWHGDYTLFPYYVEAQKLRDRRRNQELWLQGLYVYKAIGAFAEILPAFPKKNAQIHPYDSQPIALTEEENREQVQLAEQKRRLRMREYMQKRMQEVNKSMKENEQTGKE